MTRTLVRDTAGSSDPSEPPALRRSAPSAGGAARRRRPGLPIALQALAMIGIAALVYSSAADWFAALRHDSEISGYVDAVDRLAPSEREALLDAARDYNAHMPQGVLRDPYTDPVGAEEGDAAYAAYEEVLRVSDAGVIGGLSYPRLGIGLPVFHGTDDEVISRGAGHLYGSSLPIGGAGTHSVLTSHSGLLQASLFTPLPDARLGDTFQITVLGETRTYEVDRIETVLPEQTDSLRIVPGEDRVTLITCTPIGVNSHRLLVQAVRVPTPDGAGRTPVAGDGARAGFPWWALVFIAGSGATAFLLFAPPRRGGPGSRAHAGPTRGEGSPTDPEPATHAADTPSHPTEPEARA